MVKLVFMGKLGDIAPAGLAEISLPSDVATLSDLKLWIARNEPLLGEAMVRTPTRLVVNHCVASDLSRSIADGDEIAFLPPMSGG
jgi:molybdopterin converting factor small subunit